MKNMSRGPVFRTLLSFALPLFLGNVFQQLYSLVDAWAVGNFSDSPQTALAAVGASFPILFLIIAVIMGLTQGAAIMISQYFGAEDRERLRRGVSTLLIFLSAASVVMTLFGLMAAEPILRLLRTPDEVLGPATAYLRILSAGMVFMVAYNGFAAILRGVGDSKTPLYFLILASLLNVALDLVFVMALRMGTEGVAWATVISQGISAVLCLVYMRRRIPLLRFSLAEMIFDRKLFATSIRLGLPMAFQQTLVSLGNIAIQGLINPFGTVTIAAFTAATRLDAIATTFIMSVGLSVTTFTGQNVGARKLDRVRQGYLASLALVTAICLLISTLVLSLGSRLIGLFIDGAASEAIIAQGTEYIEVVSYFYLVFGIMFCTNGVLRGAGDVLFPLANTLVALSVRVIAAYVLSAIPGIGYMGLVWAIPIGWVLSTLAAFLRLASGRWKTKSVVETALPSADEAPAPG